MGPRGAYKVLMDNYVTDDAGTGIVQQAPYFGEVNSDISGYTQLRYLLSPPVIFKCLFIYSLYLLLCRYKHETCLKLEMCRIVGSLYGFKLLAGYSSATVIIRVK